MILLIIINYLLKYLFKIFIEIIIKIVSRRRTYRVGYIDNCILNISITIYGLKNRR